MNRRTLKKMCKRAMEALIAEHGYDRASFVQSDGETSIDAPRGMERRFVRNGFLEPGPLKGTWLHERRVSVEYDEWDCFLPTDELSQILVYQNFDYAEWEKSRAAA
jgi:hypothetical protein